MKVAAKVHADMHYLVVGLGVTGYAVARYLLSRGYQCKVQDSRQIPPFYAALRAEFGAVPVATQALDSALIDWADALVVSPGISIHQPLIQQALDVGKQVIGDIELFAQAVTKPVIAITGTNGKSTVASLLGEMIRADGKSVGVGGNIGVPALDLLACDVEYYVLELSSYQLETTRSLTPVAASVLNLSQDHLDRYSSYADYVQTKKHIYDGARVCVSNADDVATRNNAGDVLFSLSESADAAFKLLEDNGIWLSKKGQGCLNVMDLKISGRHNWANCLAAMALADTMGISLEAMTRALECFSGIAHRSQWVADIRGVEWINDSKATNPGAAKASIEGRNRPVILIAGGQAKNADMSILCPVLAQQVKRVFLLGEDAEKIESAWRGASDIERVQDMAAAVARSSAVAQSGDCVLLAPACASFDLYPNFEARGDDFVRCVRHQHG